MIVVLQSPSLAQRVARGGVASERKERAWTRIALAAQQQLLSRAEHARGSSRESSSRTRASLDGFSAPLDARAVALLERGREVAGVYPVRAAFPASVSSSLLGAKGVARGASSRRRCGCRATTDAASRSRCSTPASTAPTRTCAAASARHRPRRRRPRRAAQRPTRTARAGVERHGTELAGILVGAGGPAGCSGVAPGATVLPIRVAGWQPAAAGGYAVYARTDQLIAGLERAVDPNGDGDAHDAARIALVGVAEPFAAFTDSPRRARSQGALQLDTLVVAPAGNDGPAGPAFGSISGPGGAPAALTVGAADCAADAAGGPRRRARRPRRSCSTGACRSRVPSSTTRPLERELAAPHARRPPASRATSSTATASASSPAAPRSCRRRRPAASRSRRGRAAGAAVLLYGAQLPAGGLGLDEAVTSRSSPSRCASRWPRSPRSGRRSDRGRLDRRCRGSAQRQRGRVAPFSSRGLAFDGRVKPDLVAPGVALATSEPGADDDGSPRYGTVNGSSAAAAAVAGAAALLAQARPGLARSTLRSLLVGRRARSGTSRVTGQGAGLVDLGAAAAAELGADPVARLRPRERRRLARTQKIVVRNVSTRPLLVRVRSSGAAGVELEPKPRCGARSSRAAARRDR